jgi:hypothetical protein
VDYEWWAGADRYLERAGISKLEAVEILHSANRVPIPTTTDHGLPALSVWGRTDEGRPLIVLLRPLHTPVGRWQILLAIPMGPEQLAEYTHWEEQR